MPRSNWNEEYTIAGKKLFGVLVNPITSCAPTAIEKDAGIRPSTTTGVLYGSVLQRKVKISIYGKAAF